MATALTYDSLLNSVLPAYLERGSANDGQVRDQLPNIIGWAQRRIARELKITGFQIAVTGVMTTNMAVYPKPERWRQTISMNFGTGLSNNTRNFMLPRSYEFCTAYWRDRTINVTDAAEQLRYYADDYDYNWWLFAGTPDAPYPFEVLYWQLPPLLGDAVQTNWTTEYLPDLLLYACLLEATPFLNNDERIPTWQNFYDRAASAANGEDLRRILDRAQKRSDA